MNDYAAFEKVLPSKIFEYAATFKPIIAGIGGYSGSFLREHIPDSLVFEPCNIEDFTEKYNSFTFRVDLDKRRNFIEKFSRGRIMDKMVEDFLALTD